MSEAYNFSDPQGLYFTTSCVVDWIDLFTRPAYKEIIVDSLKHCQTNKGLNIHAWCLMPSHLHMIVSAKEGASLSGCFRDFKKFTNLEIIDTMEHRINESRKEWLLERFSSNAEPLQRITNYKVWQDGNQPKWLKTNEFIKQKLDYIHDNPVVEGIVDEPEHYLYSSARDYYAGKKGLIDIDFLY